MARGAIPAEGVCGGRQSTRSPQKPDKGREAEARATVTCPEHSSKEVSPKKTLYPLPTLSLLPENGEQHEDLVTFEQTRGSGALESGSFLW